MTAKHRIKPQKASRKLRWGVFPAIAISMLFAEPSYIDKMDKSTIPQGPVDTRPSISYNRPEDNTPENRKLLAQAICGEGRSEFTNDYLMGSVATMINRGNRDGIEKAILKARKKNTHHYSTFNRSDPNFKKIMNPEALDGWEKCSQLAEEILEGRPIKMKEELIGATNYFVTSGNPKKHTYFRDAKKFDIPGWAFEKKQDGKTFQLDKRGHRIPLEPLFETETNLGDNAFFYAFERY